mmetsp:Transcript_17032/g.40134  ORF Transcript_17032/g.40134 Transcript_17032/m.40134 type:complete len:712 (+) Transcript_17032:92-2227(+)
MRLVLASIWLLYTASSASSFATMGSSHHWGASDVHVSPAMRKFSTPSFLVRGGNNHNNAAPSTASSLKASVDAETTSTAASPLSPENLSLLSVRGRKAVEDLIAFDGANGAQAHVYGDWPAAGTEDEGKQMLSEQLADLNESYPGGLAAYLTKAQHLLKESADGVNPFANFEAKVPEGESLTFFDEDSSSMSFQKAEELGLKAMGDGVVFVLVAGGLGERLGYSGIKLSLETNLCTEECYLEFYIKYIQAMQYMARQKTGNQNLQFPLVIMTSGDTDPLTRQLLEDNDYFGMDKDLLTIIMQDKVAALKDGSAGLALTDDNRWGIQTKPHGHGDVHHLLYREGLVDKWDSDGLKHVVFLQDTNALVINSIIPTVGVTAARGFHMNSICIPRLAEEAAGAITKLEHKTDPSQSLVINVEYNQLDPLLRAQGTGDLPDEATGFSPFPGNANNLVMSIPEYAKTLRGEDQGVVLEFVNPKYKDETRTDFKKPTRLECMMQDIPKLYQKELDEPKIGFCMFDRWLTFSPAKNALEAGQATIAKGGTAPGTLSSAESDKYVQNQRKLEFAGFKIEGTRDDTVMMAGIPVTKGPHVILCPAFSISQEDLKEKISEGSDLTISQRSSLVLDGHHLKIDGLSLDGALVIRSGDDTHVTVKNLKIQNDGWTYTELPDDASLPEHVRIRGYTMTKHQTAEYELFESGHFVIESDGQVTKVE